MRRKSHINARQALETVMPDGDESGATTPVAPGSPAASPNTRRKQADTGLLDITTDSPTADTAEAGVAPPVIEKKKMTVISYLRSRSLHRRKASKPSFSIDDNAELLGMFIEKVIQKYHEEQQSEERSLKDLELTAGAASPLFRGRGGASGGGGDGSTGAAKDADDAEMRREMRGMDWNEVKARFLRNVAHLPLDVLPTLTTETIRSFGASNGLPGGTSKEPIPYWQAHRLSHELHSWGGAVVRKKDYSVWGARLDIYSLWLFTTYYVIFFWGVVNRLQLMQSTAGVDGNSWCTRWPALCFNGLMYHAYKYTFPLEFSVVIVTIVSMEVLFNRCMAFLEDKFELVWAPMSSEKKRTKSKF